MATVSALLDLDEDLLCNVACQAADATDLMCLAATCKAFCLIVLRDPGQSAISWTPLIKRLVPAGLGERRASPTLYQALSSVLSLRWRPLHLRAQRVSPRMLAVTLRGRTGAALCRLEGELLLFGGTLNGNAGPVLDDLLRLQYDADDAALTAWAPNVANVSKSPGASRGHTMTSTRLPDGSPCAVVLGGWGTDERGMAPVVLRTVPPERASPPAPADDTAEGDEICHYAWSRPHVAGTEPDGRAFHTTTEVSARSLLIIYGGLGSGCCRTDVVTLDLRHMAWSVPRIGGSPRCVSGRAGHGAILFESEKARGGAFLMLISGASRSTRGDAHQGSVDVLEITEAPAPAAAAPAGSVDACNSGDASASAERPASGEVHFEWSHDRSWGNIVLPEVRTATYVRFARSVLCWSGIGSGHEPADSLHVIDVDRRRVREAEPDVDVGDELSRKAGVPLPRGGAVAAPISPLEALVMCGSDHDNEWEMVHPEPRTCTQCAQSAHFKATALFVLQVQPYVLSLTLPEEPVAGTAEG